MSGWHDFIVSRWLKISPNFFLGPVATPFKFLGEMQICIARTSYGNVSVWVAGWLAVCHSRYCIRTTKPILKLFGPSASHIIEAFRTLTSIPNSKGNPSSGAFNTRRWGKIGDFQPILPIILETVRDTLMVTMRSFAAHLKGAEPRAHHFLWSTLSMTTLFKEEKQNWAWSHIWRRGLFQAVSHDLNPNEAWRRAVSQRQLSFLCYV